MGRSGLACGHSDSSGTQSLWMFSVPSIVGLRLRQYLGVPVSLFAIWIWGNVSMSLYGISFAAKLISPLWHKQTKLESKSSRSLGPDYQPLRFSFPNFRLVPAQGPEPLSFLSVCFWVPTLSRLKWMSAFIQVWPDKLCIDHFSAPHPTWPRTFLPYNAGLIDNVHLRRQTNVYNSPSHVRLYFGWSEVELKWPPRIFQKVLVVPGIQTGPRWHRLTPQGASAVKYKSCP